MVICPHCATRQYAPVSHVERSLCVTCEKPVSRVKPAATFGGWPTTTRFGQGPLGWDALRRRTESRG